MIVSSIGAKSGGRSNGRPSTVSLEAQTTRLTFAAVAAWKTFQVETVLIRKVSATGRSPGAGIAAKWTTASAPRDDVLDLAAVGEVGQQEEVVRRAVRHQVDVDDVVAVLAEVADDPSPALAAAPGDDDAHLPIAA